MKFYFFLFFILSVLLSAQSENLNSEYEAIYRVKFYADTLSKSNATQEDLSLLIKGYKSLFKSTKKAYSDSVAMEIGKKAWDNPVDGRVILDTKGVPAVNFKSEVYSDMGKQIVYKEFLKNHLAYPLEDIIKWKIEEETKMIGSYTCKKATGRYNKRNYIAWFTESVPIPDGPYVFKGLPGLVVEVYDKSDYVNFSMVSFKKVVKPIVLMKDVTSTKYSAYVKMRQNFLDNPVGTLQNQTGLTIDPKYMSQVNNNARRFNNYMD
jgi:GLPGLI family protein